jgi:uncharacterized membrane protein YfcA
MPADMTNEVLTLVLGATALVAGFLGALSGLGGGVILVPVMTLLLGVDIRYAVGASLVSVIATSSGAAAAYVREGFANIRVGMLLEVATTIGALTGAWLALHVSPAWVAIVFGLVLLHSAYLSVRYPSEAEPAAGPDPLATRLRLDGSYPGPEGPRHYHVQKVPTGAGLMAVAGALSGMLGIGSGAVKVLAMDRAMRLPFKVSTTTSNFMIGVTAAASAGVYLQKGYIDPGLAMPVVLGVLLGAMAGARFLPRAPSALLRRVFAVIIVVLAVEMIYHAVIGKV